MGQPKSAPIHLYYTVLQKPNQSKLFTHFSFISKLTKSLIHCTAKTYSICMASTRTSLHTLKLAVKCTFFYKQCTVCKATCQVCHQSPSSHVVLVQCICLRVCGGTGYVLGRIQYWEGMKGTNRAGQWHLPCPGPIMACSIYLVYQ
jgi:hypothetical protein